MFEQYTEVMYSGHYDHPIRITFKDAYIVLTGEGGNRHIIVGDKMGHIDLWVDTHLYTGKYIAFLGSTPTVTGNPSGKLVNRVWSLINQTTKKDIFSFFNWTEDSLNKFFEELYCCAKSGFYF